MVGQTKKSLGQAIDEVIDSLGALDESARLIAVKAACEKLSIPLESTRTPGVIPTAPADQQHAPPGKGKVVDIRSLKEEKNPSTDIEMAAIVAYYLSKLAPDELKKETISTSDITKYFDQADYPLPETPWQTLPNAKKAGYLDSAGRGKYKLNPVGHNLVVHNLPRIGENELARKKPLRKKKTSKKSTKRKTKK
jgi:hypothetical protein